MALSAKKKKRKDGSGCLQYKNGPHQKGKERKIGPAGFGEAGGEHEDGTQKLCAWRVYQQVPDSQTNILKLGKDCLLCKVWTTCGTAKETINKMKRNPLTPLLGM